MAIKSLFIVNDFPPILGGQSNYYFNLCTAFPQEELIILAPLCKGAQSFDAEHPLPIIRRAYLIPIFGMEKMAKILLPLFYSLSIIKKEKIKVVHCGHVLSTGVVGLILKKLLKIPYIVYTHSADILEFQKYGLIKNLLKSILNNASKISCNSRFTYGKLLELGVPEAKIQLIYPKTNFEKFNKPLRIESFQTKYSLAGKKVILSVNRLIERKGNEVMIQAMPEVLAEIPNAVYVIGGQGYYESQLRRRVKELQLESKVIFVHDLSDEDIIKLYKCCDIFVMLSRTLKEDDTEGFGVVFLEANACGKPVIGGRSGGIPEAVAEGESGLLVDPLNIKEIAEKVISLLKDSSLAIRLGTQGRKRVQDQFDAKAYLQDLNELMQGIVDA